MSDALANAAQEPLTDPRQRTLREPWPEACAGLHDMRGWKQVDCVTRDEFMADWGKRLSVFSSLTDPEGQYGPGVIYTEWGVTDGEKPWLRDYRWTGDPCTHFMPSANIAWASDNDDERTP